MKDLSQAEYQERFSIADETRRQRLEKALEHALDIRKFEIDLYWKRTAYFWAFTAFAGAGFFAVLGSDMEPSRMRFYAYVIGCVGLLFTWAWFLVNRGSKFWQENWENHVDMLEDAVTGPLYKVVLSRPSDQSAWYERLITGPAQVSVSKINQWVCAYLLLMWIGLIAHTLLPELALDVKPIWGKVIAGVGTLLAMVAMTQGGKTHKGNYTHHARLRETRIDLPSKSLGGDMVGNTGSDSR